MLAEAVKVHPFFISLLEPLKVTFWRSNQ